MTNWQDVGSGVMMWAPPAQVEVAATAQTFSRLSVDTENREDYEDDKGAIAAAPFLLCVKEENLRTKQAIFQELLSTPKEALTSACIHSQRLSAINKTSTFLEEEHSLVITPQSLLSPAASEHSARLSTRLDSVPSLEYTNILEHDSDDGTDFLATPESPCPAKIRNESPRETRFTSHYLNLKRAKVPKTVSSVRRKLDFGNPYRSLQSLQKPKKMGTVALEYSKRHNWSNEEREFLCVLFRFYARRPVDFARIYNHVFKQDLPMSKIRDQLENHMRLYGPDAYPVYKAVYSVPFADPIGEYEATRRIIEAAAVELSIELHRSSEEVVSPSGKARFSRSPRIRKAYRSLVKRAKYTHAQKTQYTQAMRLSSFAFRADTPIEAVDLVVDEEDNTPPPLPKPMQYLPATSSSTSSLAFRTWDESSGTSFCEEEGFTAGAVSIWNGHIPPFRLEDSEGKRMILITCNSHFGQDKIPSYWISVFTSLLETLVKAASFKRPRFAIVDLHHPSMQAPGKMLPAAKIMRELKSSGQTQWARTKHYAEVLVWHSIPKSAIVRSFDLRDLITLSDTYPVVEQMLQLHEFRAGRKTARVATSLAQKNITLDPFSAKAMALVCKEFGLIRLSHIQHFVARLVDGWTITDDTTADIEHVGLTFAITLGSRTYSREEVVHVFVEGCRQGTQVLQHWDSRRRSGSYRTRTR